MLTVVPKLSKLSCCIGSLLTTHSPHLYMLIKSFLQWVSALVNCILQYIYIFIWKCHCKSVVFFPCQQGSHEYSSHHFLMCRNYFLILYLLLILKKKKKKKTLCLNSCSLGDFLHILLSVLCYNLSCWECPSRKHKMTEALRWLTNAVNAEVQAQTQHYLG